MAILEAALTGLASIGGTLFANRSNARQAQRQMQFQADMSNTAEQRRLADLQAAGLNPYMSAAGSGGASTPGGAMASMDDAVGNGISSAMTARMFRENLAKAEAEAETAQINRDVARSEAAPLLSSDGSVTGAQLYANAIRAQWAADAASANAQAKYADQERALGIRTMKASLAPAEAEASLYGDGILGTVMPFLRHIPNATQGLSLLKGAATKGGSAVLRRVKPLSAAKGAAKVPEAASAHGVRASAQGARAAQIQFKKSLDSLSRANRNKPPAVGKLDSLLGATPGSRYKP